MMTSYAADIMGTSHGAHNKLAKSRSKAVVKPILKKMGGHHHHTTTQSAKSSLDLDRGWEEQIHYSSHGWGANTDRIAEEGWTAEDEGKKSIYSRREMSRSARDVSFTLSANELVGSGIVAGDASVPETGLGVMGMGDEGSITTTVAGAGNGGGRRKYSHARTASGASHASVATSGSGIGTYRSTSSFVHPFQQTPRAASPPLSLGNPRTSLDAHLAGHSRDYSPTITEDEDLEDFDVAGYTYNYNQHRRKNSNNQAPSITSPSLPFLGEPQNPSSLSTTAAPSFSAANPSATSTTIDVTSTNQPRRPSLGSKRTSSVSSDVNSALRINTNRSASVSGGSRLAHVSSTSDLAHLAENSESSSSSTPSTSSPSLTASTNPNTKGPILSPLTTASPSSPSPATMSPLRTSIDGFRLRSHSELDSNYHAERIRQERAKWQERQRQKNAKREKEELKRRAREDNKEAHRLEKEQAQIYKHAELLAKQDSKERKTQRKRHEAKLNGRSSYDAATTSVTVDDNHEIVNAGSSQYTAMYNSNAYESPQASSRKQVKAQRNRQRIQHKVKNLNIAPLPTNTAIIDKLELAREQLESRGKPQEQAEQPTNAQDVNFSSMGNRHVTTKKKAQSAWTGFMLWVRVRLLRMQSKREK